MRVEPPVFYRPIKDRICCKAHTDCRERATHRVQLHRGRRLEDRPYCTSHLKALQERMGKRLRLGHQPTPGTGGPRPRLD